MTRKAVFEEVNGFDEAFDVSYNDVDLCLRLRKRGYLVVYTPYAALYHHQSASRGAYDPEKDRKYEELLRARWSDVFEEGDPYYNPHLTLAGRTRTIFRGKSRGGANAWMLTGIVRDACTSQAL